MDLLAAANEEAEAANMAAISPPRLSAMAAVMCGHFPYQDSNGEAAFADAAVHENAAEMWNCNTVARISSLATCAHMLVHMSCTMTCHQTTVAVAAGLDALRSW